MALNIAPGVFRKGFAFEKWPDFDKELFESIYNDDSQEREFNHHVYGYDIKNQAVEIATRNVKAAGLSKYVTIMQQDIADFEEPREKALMVTNPPYGERIEDRANLPELYGALGEAYRKLDTWSMYVITAYDQAESGIGLRSSKNRKIYNGMMKTYLYEYIGPKPPRKPREGRT